MSDARLAGARVSAMFELGDRALLLDTKRRRYLVELKPGGEFHSHAGFVAHSDIVGAPEGVVVRSTKGAEYTVLRPTLEDFVVEMPRGRAGDLSQGPGTDLHARRHRAGHPGVRERGRVGCPVDDDAALGRRDRRLRDPRGLRQPGPVERALVPRDRRARPLRRPLGEQLRRDRPGRRPVRPCRARPARAVAGRAAHRAVLRAGGILVAYTPSITQAAQTREQLKGRWIDARTLEVLHRGWHIDGQAVRPDHRMVAHTGFLSVARFLGPGSRSRATAGRDQITVRCRCTRRGTPRRFR